jgi:hypothetical protein
MLTVVPVDGKTRIILSGLKSDGYANEILSWFRQGYRRNKITIENFITKLILHNSNNLFLSPSYWNEMSSELKEKIRSFISGSSNVDLGQFNLLEKPLTPPSPSPPHYDS